MKKLSDSALFILGGVAGSCITLMIKRCCDTKRENIQDDLDDLYQLSAEIKGDILNNYEYITEDNTKNLIKMLNRMDELYAEIKRQNTCSDEFMNKAEDIIKRIHSAQMDLSSDLSKIRDTNRRKESSSKGIMEPDDEEEILYTPSSLMKTYGITVEELAEAFNKIGEKDTALSISGSGSNYDAEIITEREYEKIVDFLNKENKTKTDNLKENKKHILIKQDMLLSELAKELDTDPISLKKEHQIMVSNIIKSICMFNKEDLSNTYNAEFSVESPEDYIKRFALSEEKVSEIAFLESDLPSFSVFDDIENESTLDVFYNVMGH